MIKVFLTYQDQIARVVDTNTPHCYVDINWGKIEDFPRTPAGLIDPRVFECYLLQLAAGALRWSIESELSRVSAANRKVAEEIRREGNPSNDVRSD